MVRLGHVEILATDPAATVRFYVEGLGFSVGETQGGATWLRAGAVEIAVRKGTKGPRAGSYDASGAALVVYVDDLDRALARLKSFGLDPAGHDGSPRCPLFRDPDGNWVQVVDPRDFGGSVD